MDNWEEYKEQQGIKFSDTEDGRAAEKSLKQSFWAGAAIQHFVTKSIIRNNKGAKQVVLINKAEAALKKSLEECSS